MSVEETLARIRAEKAAAAAPPVDTAAILAAARQKAATERAAAAPPVDTAAILVAARQKATQNLTKPALPGVVAADAQRNEANKDGALFRLTPRNVNAKRVVVGGKINGQDFQNVLGIKDK